MYRKEVNQQSPIRILEQSIHGGLGKGNLGVVMSRAGVGKTACLVQIGLDDLMRERPVLHVAIDQTVEHVQSWYDALFDDIAITSDLDDVDSARQVVHANRMIAAFTDHDIWPDRLQSTVESFEKATGVKPAAILVDGFPWHAHTAAKNGSVIGAFKSYAKLLGAELWMSAQTHRDQNTELTAPWDQYDELIDVAVYLDPQGEAVSLRLLKDHDNPTPPPTKLTLHPDTLRLVVDGEDRRPRNMPNSAFTLLSGGAKGAEAEFGACAEKWGLTELNFTFEGRNPARQRALVQLTAEELAQGAVSPVYVQAHLKRDFPDTQIFRKTLQSIWHQVSTAGEIFTIGWIQDDKTVKGGTGWAAELGRHWHKPTYVFDQARERWFVWDSGADDWKATEPPRIEHRRFTGTGTRELQPVGAKAIRDLFQRSFGEPPSWAGSEN